MFVADKMSLPKRSVVNAHITRARMFSDVVQITAVSGSKYIRDGAEKASVS